MSSAIPHLLAVGTRKNGDVRLMYPAIGRQQTLLAAPTDAPFTTTTAIAFSPDATRLAVVTNDGNIAIWSVASAELLCRFHFDDTRALVFSVIWLGIDTVLATGTNDNIYTFDATTGHRLSIVKEGKRESRIYCSAASSDGRLFATGAQGGPVVLWDSKTLEELCSVKMQDHVWSVAFFPCSTRVIAGCKDGTARVFAVSSSHAGLQPSMTEILKLERMLFGEVHRVAVSPDSTTIATSARGNIVLWSSVDGVKLRTLEDVSQLSDPLSFSFDGRLLACPSSTGGVRIWDVGSGEEHKELERCGGAPSYHYTTCVAFAPCVV